MANPVQANDGGGGGERREHGSPLPPPKMAVPALTALFAMRAQCARRGAGNPAHVRHCQTAATTRGELGGGATTAPAHAPRAVDAPPGGTRRPALSPSARARRAVCITWVHGGRSGPSHGRITNARDRRAGVADAGGGGDVARQTFGGGPPNVSSA